MTIVTEMIAVDRNQPDPSIIGLAAHLLQNGGLVAFPTETVYGLGANALDAAAAQRIFVAKGRPAHDPLIVHVPDQSWLEQLAVEIPDAAWRLSERFWPGALTLVLRKRSQVPDIVTAGGATVAIRAPNHPVAQALIRAAQLPIAAPSANRFSHTSPTTARHVWDDLNGRIEMILDGGSTPIGVESTVIDVTGDVPLLLRPGGVPLEALRAVLGHVEQRVRQRSEQALPSPGMLDRHYAPTASLWLFQGRPAEVSNQLLQTLESEQRNGRRVGVLLSEEDAADLSLVAAQIMAGDRPGQLVVESLGSFDNLDEVAQRLFAAMRSLDAAGVEIILAHEFPVQGLGLAINDRLRRAAERVIVL
ncbi:MAG: L-threonylcarbamoyladenylate synthase [Caldilineaceae bacterium]